MQLDYMQAAHTSSLGMAWQVPKAGCTHVFAERDMQLGYMQAAHISSLGVTWRGPRAV